MPISWAPEVFVEGKWSRNALRFRTEAEAMASASCLFHRWTSTQDFRATEATEPPNYAIDDGRMVELPRAVE